MKKIIIKILTFTSICQLGLFNLAFATSQKDISKECNASNYRDYISSHPYTHYERGKGCYLRGAVLKEKGKVFDIIKDNLSGADLKGAVLSSVIAGSADFRNADLSEADLSGGSFYQANFSWANLNNANLSYAGLNGGVDLSHANLSHANLSHADLRGVDFRNADLYWANFQEAKLFGANLRGVSLKSVDLYWADLSGVDLSLTLSLGEAKNLNTIRCDDETDFPGSDYFFKKKYGIQCNVRIKK